MDEREQVVGRSLLRATAYAERFCFQSAVFAASLSPVHRALLEKGAPTVAWKKRRPNRSLVPGLYFVRSTRTLQPHGSTYMSQLPSIMGFIFTFG